MARNFTGSDFINCGNGSVLDIGNNAPFSMAIWVNFNSLVAPQNFLNRGFNVNQTCYQFTLDSNTTIFIGCFVGSNHGVQVTHGWTTGTWHHAYGDYNGSAWHIRLDGGTLNTNIDAQGPIFDITPPNGIGAISVNGTPLQFCNGKFADAAIWNGPLSAEEVAALAKGLRPYMIRSRTLLGYWPLDGIQSPEPDLSGNKNNGTLTGTSAAEGPPVTMFTPRKPSNALALPSGVAAQIYTFSQVSAHTSRKIQPIAY